ncbi:MBOAT-domain-containing protein [Wallemia mellicola]|nr:MBOAT-domain-containing protein [Wallemia mellicola]
MNLLQSSQTNKSRWGSNEFKIYYLVFIIMIPIIFYIPIDISNIRHINYSRYSGRLANGWLFNRKIDLTDQQYKSFRNNLRQLVCISLIHVLISKLIKKINKLTELNCDWILCVAVLLGLHSYHFVFPLAISIASYALSKFLAGYKYFYVFIWLFNISTLVAIEYYNGISFALIHPSLGYLNSSKGLVRWYVFYKMTTLRNISFALDLHWMRMSYGRVIKPLPMRSLTYSERKNTSLEEQDYGLFNFLYYVFYPPLYLAGPIMTYNDFIHQSYLHFNRPTMDYTLKYALRCLSTFLTLEISLHFIYVVAIKNTGAWRNDTPSQIALIGFWNLIVVWLKLLIPWRFFRLWSLADGIECPENMIRCVANNYSTTGFWRSWHRSYNLWIIRYLYVPLGGAKYAALITPVIFVFVALWHDLNWRLLVWGGLASGIILPELLATYLLPPHLYNHRWWYRHLCAVGGVLNILALMGANLVGFVLGIRNTKDFLIDLVCTAAGWKFLAVALPSLFVGVQVMFELREAEKRKGIYLRC